MPTAEQQPQHQPPAPTSAPSETEVLDGTSTLPEQIEQRDKTIATKVDEQIHAELQFIADLAGTSLSEEVRRAIKAHIEAAREDPQLIERAQRVREEIEREAAARTAAIAGFMGQQATAAASEGPTSSTRGQRSRATKTTNL